MKSLRQKYVPARLQHGESQQHHFESVESMLRAQCNEAIDTCLSELTRRFDQESYKILINMEEVILSCANGDFTVTFSETVKSLYEIDVDFHRLSAQLQLLPGVMAQNFPEVKKVTSFDTVLSLLKDNHAKLLFSELKKLIQIYLLVPMSIASG
jgi:hypothetical protein